MLPAGTLLVPLPQPAGAIARNLLDAQVPMNEEFMRRQEERRKSGAEGGEREGTDRRRRHGLRRRWCR